MALYDLKCPDLKYVYRMTWAEFQLRLIGFNNSLEREAYQRRELAWAFHVQPKKGQRIDSWWKIGSKVIKRASEQQKEYFLKKYKDYLDKKNDKLRGTNRG